MGWQDDTRAAARRAGIDPALYVALVRQESQGHQYSAPGVVLTSPAGALGRAQLMPDTARGLGVDPRDPQQNLLGGALYLKQQLRAFGGDPAKALAAYNAGPGAVQKAGGVPQIAETQAYVRKILGSLGGNANGSVSGGADAPADAGAPARQAPSVLGGGGDSSAVIAALAQAMSGQQRQAPPSSQLQAPSFAAGPTLAGAVPSSGGGPVPRQDISALISAAAAASQGGDAPVTPAAGSDPASSDASGAASAPSAALGEVKLGAGANRAGASLTPGIQRVLGRLAATAGPIEVGTGTNHSQMTTSGNVSDHWEGNAADVPASGQRLTTLAKDALLTYTDGRPVQWLRNDGSVQSVKVTKQNAATLAAAGGIFNVPYGKKRRIQVIAHTQQGGNHENHLHVGVTAR